MTNPRLLARYAVRLARGEWSKYLLPFLSLALTALVVTSIVLTTGSVEQYLAENNRIALGGDIALESNFPIDNALLADAVPSVERTSSELTFSGTMGAEGGATGVSYRVVDSAYPLVGTVVLADDVPYQYPADTEVLLDREAAERLGVMQGSTVYIGETPFRVAALIVQEPDALFGGFRFLPRALLSREGLARTTIDAEFLRAQYTLAATLAPQEQAISVRELRERIDAPGIRIEAASEASGGVLAGLGALQRFLGIAVLVTALLAIVNVYVSILSIERRLQHTFAILRALGAPTSFVVAILGTLLGGIVLLAAVVGLGFGYELATVVRQYVAARYTVALPLVIRFDEVLYIFGILAMTMLAASAPAVGMYRSSSPRAMLRNEEHVTTRRARLLQVLVATLIVGAPLMLLAQLTLRSFALGLVALGALVCVYGFIVFVYRAALALVYKARSLVPFSLRTVIAFKHYDGMFGAVSFGSLFLGLAALSTLALTHASLTAFLTLDISRTLPTLYVIDVQPSQQQALQDRFPDLTLFPNVGARILRIDDTLVQEALEDPDASIDRELGREFNVTYRTDLLTSERVVAGTFDGNAAGVFSVEEEFAKRAGMELGSTVVLLIQGFEVVGTVGSIRTADTRSGLPFFYIVGTPADFAAYPATYFGYLYGDAGTVGAVQRYVAEAMPNVSVLDTSIISTLSRDILDTVVLLSFIIALPGLVLACILIAVLVLLSFDGRRRDGARLLALGVPLRSIERIYIAETVSTTLAAAVLAYGGAALATLWVVDRVLALDAAVLFDLEVLITLGALVACVAAFGLLLWRSNKKPLQQVLAYEENY